MRHPRGRPRCPPDLIERTTRHAWKARSTNVEPEAKRAGNDGKSYTSLIGDVDRSHHVGEIGRRRFDNAPAAMSGLYTS